MGHAERARRRAHFLLLFMVLGAGRAWPQSPPERITTRLTDQGFENVAVELQDSTVTVWFENRIYRDDLTGLGVAAWLAVAELDSASVLELVPENRGVALIAVSAPVAAWRSFLAGDQDAAYFRSVLRIDLDRRRSGLALSPRGLERHNSSRLRTDLQLRPLFSFQVGNGSDPFDYTLAIAPEAVMSPLSGGLITLQAAIRIHDDFDPCGEENPCGLVVKPTRNTVSWGGWLPANCLFAVSGGLFPSDRYGFAGEVGRLFLNGQLEVWAGGDLTGELLLTEDVVEYSDMTAWSAFAAATHRFRGLDIESTLTFGRFYQEEGDLALKLELARRIEEFEIGFFGATHLGSDLSMSPYEEGNTSVGVNLRFALPVRTYARPKRFRPTTVPDFPFTYRSTVDPVAVPVSMFDNLDRLRKRLYPTFIWNRIEELRLAGRYVRGEGGS